MNAPARRSDPTTIYLEVKPGAYRKQLRTAQKQSATVSLATTAADQLDLIDTRCVLATDGLSGYAVRGDGELLGVFSLVRGRGTKLVQDAVFRGATHLDCFDGYLPAFYARAGFVEVRREPNWAPGGPDIIWMELQS